MPAEHDARFDPVFSYPFAREHGLILVECAETCVLAAKGAPGPQALLEARRVLRRPFTLQPVSERAFEELLGTFYAVEGLGAEDLDEGLKDEQGLDALVDDIATTSDLLDGNDDAPVIRLINGLIAEAVKLKASDIHVEPYENALSVRLRVDGVLNEVLSLSARTAPLIVSRIKVMARLDIAEKRIPQDGRISLTIGGKALDVRVSTLPARHGERVVMRLLDKDQDHFDLNQLGMPPELVKTFRRVLDEPNGILLVTGPTGSGKTTSLYAGLAELNDRSRNILTVEDPVEYGLDGVGQTQVNAKVGMTFAAGLRAILRQDPDVVMVGEIRDLETVQIAVQASLTGHLVLSTVHTNSAIAAVTRLRDMGVEPFLLASTLKAVMAQRLVRRLCSECAREVPVGPLEAAMFQGLVDCPRTHRIPVGCPECSHTGYRGRVGLYELVRIDETLARMIHDDAREQDMEDYAFQSSQNLLQSGLGHAAAGTTSLAEIMRVCRHQDADDGSV
ncbi:MAG: type II secretion system ATPase GspE [Pseudomonadota bacterium]